MVYTFSVTDQTVNTDESLAFNTDGVVYGSCTSHWGNPNVVQLRHAGLYYVSFNASLSTTETTGDLAAQLQVNGVDYPGALATAGVADGKSLSFSALVKVLPNCCAVDSNIPASVSVINTGVDAIYSNAALTIIKIR